MDLMVDPVHERLTGVHGNQPVHVLYSLGCSPRLYQQANPVRIAGLIQ
jgi:hypothetical protein